MGINSIEHAPREVHPLTKEALHIGVLAIALHEGNGTIDTNNHAVRSAIEGLGPDADKIIELMQKVRNKELPPPASSNFAGDALKEEID